MADHYATLGVDSTATSEEIKRAYRKLANEHHPDKGGDPEKFKDLGAAYSVLSDNDKRQHYDNPNPFERMFGDGFGGGMGPGFGFRRPKPRKPDLNAPMDGQFLGMETKLPLKLFLFGGKFKVVMSYHEGCTTCGGKGFEHGEECDMCHGDGYMEHVQRQPGFVSSAMRPCAKCHAKGVMGTDVCGKCNGSGNVLVHNNEFVFDVPPGASPGAKLIMHSAGRAGLNGGRRGDVGIMVVGLESPDLNKLTPEQIEELKSLLEVLDNDNESA